MEHGLAGEQSESSGEAELAFGERCWLGETRGFGLRLLQWARNRDRQCRCLAGFSMGFFVFFFFNYMLYQGTEVTLCVLSFCRLVCGFDHPYLLKSVENHGDL